MISETCRCGAAFAIEKDADLKDIFRMAEYGPWHLWQEHHATVCDVMAGQIAPRLAREAAQKAAEEERKAKQRQRAKDAKAAKEARASS